MRFKLNSILLLSAACILATSCKKKKSEVFEALLGSWTINKVAVDKNGNGNIDSNETTRLSTPIPMYSFYFNRDRNGMYFLKYKDSTGRIVANNTGFKYSVDDNILTIDNTNYTHILDNGKRTIVSITAEEMVLKEATPGAANWSIYRKQ